MMRFTRRDFLLTAFAGGAAAELLFGEPGCNKNNYDPAFGDQTIKNQPLYKVDLVQLVSDPKKYHGRIVETSGFLEFAQYGNIFEALPVAEDIRAQKNVNAVQEGIYRLHVSPQSEKSIFVLDNVPAQLPIPEDKKLVSYQEPVVLMGLVSTFDTQNYHLFVMPAEIKPEKSSLERIADFLQAINQS